MMMHAQSNPRSWLTRPSVYTEGACFYAGTRRECGSYAYYIPQDGAQAAQQAAPQAAHQQAAPQAAHPPFHISACSQRPGTTNQHMQVTAAIQGIQALAQIVARARKIGRAHV